MAVPAAKYTAQVSFLTTEEQKDFVTSESDRREVSAAEIWREITELGIAAYRKNPPAKEND